ncbi:MAG: nitroreductase family protein, partial [Candidatus Brocadiae bacterium]|nr:nitroreductase family protein [Candidatus Brocadiia bacterium]
KGDELHYLVEANGFLYNMVRIIVGTLLEVGRGKITAREFREILNACDRKAAGPTAPARGLTLVRVNYPNDARRTTWKTEDGGERMDFFEVIEGRASVRSFVKCEIPEADLTRILDAGRRAPSGHNHQPWEFILIRSPDTLKQLGKIQGCIAEASAAIAVVMDESASEFWKEDAGAAIENMLLATVALGYASLWVEGYVLRHEDYGKEVLDVPKDRRLLAILPIGKPASPPSQAQKKPLSEILHRERYGGA